MSQPKEYPFLPLRSVLNVRDLGGLTTASGKALKKGVLLRGAHLAKLSRKDREQLQDTYHVHTVVDLRTGQEQKEKPDRNLPGASHLSLPVFDEATSGISYENSQSMKDKVKAIPNMPELYKDMVTRPEYVDNLKAILYAILEETIAHGGEGAVYYHCTAGKDRTGIVTLLLLTLLEVPEDTILEEYLQTNRVRYTADNLRILAVRFLLRDPATTKALQKVFRAEPEYLNAAVTAIEETYGSISAFLTGPLQVTASQRKAFQEALLEP